MRGSPLIRVLLLVAALGVTSLPLSCVLNRKPSQAIVEEEPATISQTKTLRFTLESTGSPTAIEILLEGDQLLTWTPGSPSDIEQNLPVVPEGVDLVVRAHWPDQERQALRIKVADHRGPIADQTFWGSGEWEDVLVLPGGTP